MSVFGRPVLLLIAVAIYLFVQVIKKMYMMCIKLQLMQDVITSH